MKSPELKKIIENIFPNTKYISITDRDYSHLDLEWIENGVRVDLDFTKKGPLRGHFHVKGKGRPRGSGVIPR